jgi:P-type Mg2+ transporter
VTDDPATSPTRPSVSGQPTLAEAAGRSPIEALTALGSRTGGLSTGEADERRALFGANALRAHGVSAFEVLLRQLKSYLLALLLVAAAVSAVVGDVTEAAIIVGIMAMSVGLGFANEYRSERAVEALHDQIQHHVLAERDGRTADLDVTELVPGDVVHVKIGDVVPADLRLLEAAELECDESALTGESAAAPKQTAAVPAGESPVDLPCCAFMGTIVTAGSGTGLVVATGSNTAFGAIAASLGTRHAKTGFQHGLQDFSRLLATITGILAGGILVINVAIGRSFLESLLFALAIAVGLTPQLLPAIVTVSLATGSRRLVAKQVIVKRLVCIEDLGNMEVLFTDKTGTLTAGHTTFERAVGIRGEPDDSVLGAGVACSEATGNDLDRALHEHVGARVPAWTQVDRLPFDHDRQLASVLVDADGDRLVIVKGAPEAVVARSDGVPQDALDQLDVLFAAGTRVVAVATRPAPGLTQLTRGDEQGLSLRGFLCFSDPPKPDAAESVRRLAELGVTVKVITGDNGRVAARVCEQVGLAPGRVVTGQELAAMSDEELASALPHTLIFARVTPEQKAHVLRVQRSLEHDVGFLGDGVNDAVALHAADVGISVESAAEVAKGAADVVLLTKSLATLADGVVEGRRIFANTIKYVLMSTSSNFGNMFSAAGASLFLSFLPMLPTQILLNNLLYDVSELTIPTDTVDPELVARPAQWDIGLIRRFMYFFGPISSVYDFVTFAVMLRVFHAGPELFHSGWFVESLVTQTLVIFVIRTRRVPFFRSRPSRPLLITTLLCAGFGAALPYIGPLARIFGFRPLPASFMAILVVMIITYLALAQLGTALFFRPWGERSLARRVASHERRIRRRAARWKRRPAPGSR